ncbi:MAG: efflux RND transporter permease subunit [candidate division Zixibacteria bacterium]|nr:efflux RND transporter permease subunit [candidate division Zixibacteria bacterium]
MRNFIRSFIKYPILGNSILFAVFLFGILAFINTKITFFPQIPSDTIIIQASYPGASPEEIEEGIVLKIEDNLKGVTGIDRITSTSSENSGTITVELLYGYDINVALQDVKNAVDQISSFPADMDRVLVYKQEMREFAISFIIRGDVELSRLKQTALDIERDLLDVDGISKTAISGYPSEEIEVSLRENDLRKYGLTFQDVATAIGNANVKMTGGTIKGETEELLIRADTRGYYAADLADHVIKATSDGTIIRLKDIADLSDGWSDSPDRIYFNGQLGVRITVSSTNEEDLYFTCDYVKQYIANFNETHHDMHIDVLRDGSDIIRERVNILTDNGILGLILVLLFLSLALNMRLSVWVALAIPVSFAGMFMIGTFYGLTINVMSLMAMILVVGILVDDGIVFAENIYQQYERGKKPIQAALDGTLEVLPAVSASILTTVIIFMTFFFLQGSLGERTRDIAFVVAATLIFSLVEGIFILPSHVAHSKALKTKREQKNLIERKSEAALLWIRDRLFAPLLKFCISNPIVAVAVPVALFVITVGGIKGSVIKTTFFPVIEGDRVEVSLEMPAGTPEKITNGLLVGMESAVWNVNEAYRQEHDGVDIVKSIGRSIGPKTHKGELTVTLIESAEREWSNMEVANRIRNTIGVVEGVENLEIGDGGGRFGKPIEIVLKSDNLGSIHLAKDSLEAALRKVDKLKDVVDDDPPGLREVTITLKDKAYALGLTTTQVMRQVRGGFFGSEAQRILRGVDEVRIYVRYQEAERSTLAKLADMRIRTANGSEFPLEEIANLEIKRGVIAINHIDARRVISVSANIADSKESVTDIIADIKAEIMPQMKAQFPDVTFDFEGQSRESAKTVNAMLQVVPPMLTLMFLIIVVTFRSFVQAVVVLVLIPFSMVGVAWGHYLQGYTISMLSLFGTIALAGIVVNDSLVLVNALNRILKRGTEFRAALYEAGISRFRPVLLTSLTTIAGLGPLMFSRSHHAQFLSPLAISVAYGLLFGTILTLLMLPASLMLVNRVKVYGYWLVKHRVPEGAEVEPAVREEFFVKEQESQTDEGRSQS